MMCRPGDLAEAELTEIRLGVSCLFAGSQVFGKEVVMTLGRFVLV